MDINVAAWPFQLRKDFVGILESEVEKSGESAESGIVLTFCDHNYSPETGGWHPVEVRLAPDGTIEYVTDFAYVGIGPCAELAKEIDFDFALGLFQHFGRKYPIESEPAMSLFRVWERNFVEYHRTGAYSILVTPG